MALSGGFREIEEHDVDSDVTSCALCGVTLETRFREVLDPESRRRFPVLSCPQCGLGRTVAPIEDLNDAYSSSYHGGRHGITASFCDRRRLRIVRSVVKSTSPRRLSPGRLLDIGCGDGSFLLLARSEGWTVVGTEPFPKIARQAGLEVPASPQELDGDRSFDCVTLWHVLEHLFDPVETIARVRRITASDGVLIVAVPNNGGTQARLFGSRWFHLDVPRHLFHFDQTSLGNLIRDQGFEVVRQWDCELEYDLMGWAQTVLNRLFSEPNVFFNVLTGRKTRSGRIKRSMHVILGFLLLGLGLLPTWIGMLAGGGGTLVVAARPSKG